jgi:hypothetical protein
MNSSEPIPHQDLATSEAWNHYPGSVRVWSEAYDEGEGHGFDGHDLSACIREYRRVEADPDEIVDWYGQQLLPRGWHESEGFGPETTGGVWKREGPRWYEVFWVIIRRPARVEWPPPGGWDGPGTVFDVMYQAASSAATAYWIRG